MACREEQVLEAIRAAIATIPGTGSYHFNLTGTDVVTVSEVVTESARVPRVHVVGGPCRSSGAPAMTHRTRELDVEIVGVFPAETQTTQARGAAGYRGASDIRQKLEAKLLADRLGGLVIELEIDVTGVDGQEIGFGHVGVAHADVKARWDAAIGGGAA